MLPEIAQHHRAVILLIAWRLGIDGTDAIGVFDSGRARSKQAVAALRDPDSLKADGQGDERGGKVEAAVGGCPARLAPRSGVSESEEVTTDARNWA
jgi:hypothetical protein